MKRFSKYLFKGFKYLLMQGLVEIILIVLLEYCGVRVLSYFSKAALFIENIQGVAWEISMKTIIFSIIYVPVFIVACALLGWEKSKSHLVYSVINAFLSLILSLVFLLLLRQENFFAVINLLISTVSSSMLILIIAKILDNRKRQTLTD